MAAPRVTVGGKTLEFQPNGDVRLVEGESSLVRGRWHGRAREGDEKANMFRYSLDDADQTALRAVYSFDDSNQLVVRLEPADGEASEPAALPGGIEIDDNHDVLYSLVDENGDPTGGSVVVYGTLRFDEGTNDLVITLEGGGEAFIKGESGIASIEAVENQIEEFDARDLLRFVAITRNRFEAMEFPLPVEAKIEFIGQWDIVPNPEGSNQLVFFSKVKGDPQQPDVKLGFAGTIGAVTAGFVYFADKDGTKAAFSISGKHHWNSEAADTQFAWQSHLGFSDKKFEASLAVDSRTTFAGGGVLAIAGDFTLRKEDGSHMTMQLNLAAKYEWKGNVLVFKADVSSEDDALNYNLTLEGTFRWNKLAVSFAVKLAHQGETTHVQVALSIQGDRDSAIKAISLILDIDEEAAGLRLELTFEVRLRWANGVPVKEPAGQLESAA